MMIEAHVLDEVHVPVGLPVVIVHAGVHHDHPVVVPTTLVIRNSTAPAPDGRRISSDRMAAPPAGTT